MLGRALRSKIAKESRASSCFLLQFYEPVTYAPTFSWRVAALLSKKRVESELHFPFLLRPTSFAMQNGWLFLVFLLRYSEYAPMVILYNIELYAIICGMTELSEVLAVMVPKIYADSAKEFRWHPNTDMSRSSKCHTMTLDLLRALDAEGITARRELHRNRSGYWHYIIGHAPRDAEPTMSDVITDLSPWQFDGGERFTGYLHDTRLNSMISLDEANSPAGWTCLRDLATIAMLHDERIAPFSPLPPLAPAP